MKRTALAALAIAALPLAAAPMAMAGITATTPTDGTAAVPNATKTVKVAAGSTTRVALGTVNAGTGYAWRWITRPKASVAKGLPVHTSKATRPGGPTTVTVGVRGVSGGSTTTGKLGLFGPGQATPTRTTTLKITVLLGG